MPSVLALIRHLFADPKQLGAAYGIWGTSIMAGVVLGVAAVLFVALAVVSLVTLRHVRPTGAPAHAPVAEPEEERVLSAA